MYTRNKLFLLLSFFLVLFSSVLNAGCSPSGTAGDDTVTCTGVINSFQYFYGGSDKVTLNGVMDITYNHAYWLDESLGGNPATDGNDIFISHDSRFSWVLGFGGDDQFEVDDSIFQNLYADTNPGHGVSQRGNDTIYLENSVSNGWILGGNDNDMITIKDSRVSFVAAGYSDVLSDLPGYIDYTPYDGNDTIILDNVDFGEPNYYYTTRPGAVEGGKEDDLIVFRNGGSAYGVTGGHGNDRIVVEDDMLFNACTFPNDRGNSVACGIYGDEPYVSEPNATTIALHGDDEIMINAGNLSGIVVNGGHGSDIVTISVPVQLLDTNLSGGDDRSIADGFVDRLVFDGWVGDLNGSQLQNWETIVFDNDSEITFLDDNISVGYETGSDPVTHLPYGLVLQNDASLKVSHDLKIDGNLYNRAVLDLQMDGNLPQTILSIENNYDGDNGVIFLDTVLNDAATSTSDVLVIKGNTSGKTMLSIHNVNGLGGQTPTGDNEGILVVEVGGASKGEFSLEFDLSVGDYSYELVKGSTGNWYLQSHKIKIPPIPPEDAIDALDSQLTVNSYTTYKGQLPAPGADTTCSGPFIYELLDDVKHGELTLDPVTGSYTYVSQADYYGADSFDYRIISDQCSKESNVATVAILIGCASSQSSDSGSIFGLMNILMMLFFTINIGSYFMYKDERSS